MVVAAGDLLRSMNSHFVDLGPKDSRYQKLTLAIERQRIHRNRAAFFGEAQTILDHMTAAQDPKGLRCFEQVVYLNSSHVFHAVPLWTTPEYPSAEGLLRNLKLRLFKLLQSAPGGRRGYRSGDAPNRDSAVRTSAYIVPGDRKPTELNPRTTRSIARVCGVFFRRYYPREIKRQVTVPSWAFILCRRDTQPIQGDIGIWTT
ncbi:hypothetical protein TI39_contig4202g00008 [Zymoseptoria brevis]|uniref:Uncharacterized protein n=1 Tax=Zymoseptoria brevis TaxID=1047168 RepID=A0A0F4GBD5_9PEZI|nr:hypothetical protein TI39_contig4202g00008 [Zymoseptoria brevis]